eukprot:TRINITY_DN5937_c0_g2_i9.p1 TRINITY_DN5937_c0_g2~~TRINITY_DN5937_c0_g2_i9.p1  ORF type:complete len:389 (+),score=67.90 TRINITY_DN5937_c0_g2_i9:83-1249(+)
MYLTLEGLGRKKNRYKNYPEGPDSGKREIQEPKTEVKFSEPGVSIDEQERLKVLPGDLITPTRKDLRFLTKSDGLHDAERPSLSKKGRSRTLSFSKDVLSKKSSTEKESDRTRISRSQSLNKNKEGSERHLKKDCTPSLVEPLEPKGTCMETRRRVFSNWINFVLQDVLEDSTASKPKELDIFFQDGIFFCYLVEKLSGRKMLRWHFNPKDDLQKIDNIQMAIDHISSLPGKFNLDIDPTKIVQQRDEKSILEYLFLISQVFYFGCQFPQSYQDSTPHVIAWFREKTSLSFTNFDDELKEGITLAQLLNYLKPSVISEQTMMRSQGIRLLEHALQVAYEECGIPNILLASDLIKDHLDIVSNSLYISLITHEILKKKKKKKKKKSTLR